MARILVAGCGYVGAVLAEHLAASGHDVWGLRRSHGGLPAGVRGVSADLAVLDSLERALGAQSFDFVVYCAAPSERSEEAYRTVYVDGLRNLLAVTGGTGVGPRRAFLTTSTGVYAQQHGEWVDEDSPTRPESFSGRLLLEGERVLHEQRFPTTALRLAGIYGPGRTSLVDRVRSGVPLRAGEGSGFTNRIHRDDAAGAIAQLIERDLAGDRVEETYVGVDHEPVARREVLRWIAGRLGIALREESSETAGAERETPFARGNKRCRNDRLLASGYRFRYPTFREGYGALLESPAD